MINLLKRICFLVEAIAKFCENVELRVVATLLGKDKDAPRLESDNLLDLQQVLRILKIGRSTYYRYVNEGKLIPRRIGIRHCYYIADLEAMIDQSRRKGRL